MNVFVARAAIIFAGIIVAGALLNLFALVATFTVGPLLGGLGFNQEQEFTLIYWPCLAAGFVTAFFLMRPVWNSAGKTAASQKSTDNKKADQQNSN